MNAQGDNGKYRRAWKTDVVNLGSEYLDEEIEFLKAVDRFRRENRVAWPSCVDVLRIAKALGWRKVS